MAPERANGIVYILSNEAMPGQLKIGQTGIDRGRQRIRELFTTGVPMPFNVEYAAYVGDPRRVEGEVHAALSDARVHQDREWFRVDPDRARAALEPYAECDATPDMLAGSADLPAVDLDAGARPLSRRPRREDMDFFAMGLRRGDRLTERDSGRQVYVEDRRRVYFKDAPAFSRSPSGWALTSVYTCIHDRRGKNKWVTDDGTRVYWLWENVQLGDQPPPWPDREKLFPEA